MTLPVSVFVLQMVTSIALEQEASAHYVVFLTAYFVAFLIGIFAPQFAPKTHAVNPNIDPWINAFLVTKGVVVLYFGMIFVHYVIGNGYESIRQYMTSDEVRSSPFYFAPLMYIDAYILYPLNYIILLLLYLQRRTRAFYFLLVCILLHNVIFYASRIILYNILILFFFAVLHQRLQLGKVVRLSAIAASTTLSISLLVIFNRDSHFTFEGARSIGDSLIVGVLFYHIVPPLIFSAILEGSSYFNSGAGYGLATFGFLVDPFLSVLMPGEAKSLMSSKILSAEAQNFVISDQGLTFNAFTTFLYPAVYDFGWIGPALYGLFFGFFIGHAFNRRDGVGFVRFVIFSYFVFFNSFTFFITGDWLWAIILTYFCFKPVNTPNEATLKTTNP